MPLCVMEFEDALRTVANSIRKGRCLPFVGAGVSAWREADYPRPEEWAELVDCVLRQETPRDANGVIHQATQAAFKHGLISKDEVRAIPIDISEFDGSPPTWFLHLALIAASNRIGDCEYLSQKVGRAAQKLTEEMPELCFAILSRFFPPDPSKAKPNSLHRYLALFPFEHIVTTNFDCCIERARSDVGAAMEAISDDEELCNKGLGGPRVLKIHGQLGTEGNRQQTATESLKRIVLDLQDFNNFPQERQTLKEYVRVLTYAHRVVLLGYTLDDSTILDVFREIMRQTSPSMDPPIFVTWPGDTSGRSNDLAVAGFRVVKCDIEKFIRDLWQNLFAGVDLEYLQSLRRSSISEDLRFEIPVTIFLQRAMQVPQFKENLQKALWGRYFPGDLFDNQPPDFQKSLQTLLGAGWLRKVEDSGGTVFYETAPEIHEKLLKRLGVI